MSDHKPRRHQFILPTDMGLSLIPALLATKKQNLATTIMEATTDAATQIMHEKQTQWRALAELPATIAVKQTAENYETLLKDYNRIGKQPEIHGHDFLKAENTFNHSLAVESAETLHKLGKMIDTSAPAANYAYEAVLNAPPPAVGDPEDLTSPLGGALAAARNKVRPDTLSLTSPDAQLELKFARQHGLTGNEHAQVPATVRSQEQLIAWTLKHHEGFALADMHNRADALNFLTERMELLKKNGVTTLYTEYPDAPLYHMTKEQLQAEIKIKERTPGDNKQYISWAYNVPLSSADDVCVAEAKTALAAKEHGVRIVHVDKALGMARQVEPFCSRDATTNFIMTDNILEDRKKHPGGKYIVFAGMTHLTSVLGAYDRSNGFISKALHIPLLAFKDKAICSPPLEISTNPNGPDAYMPSRGGYEGVSILSEHWNAVDMLAEGAIVPPLPLPLPPQKTVLRKR